MIMGAMMVHGLIPGPTLFRDETALVYVIFLAMVFSNLLILAFGLSLARFIAKIAIIDKKYLIPFVLILSITGPSISYGHIYYFWISIIFGFLGYLFEKGGFPVITVAMVLIIGPIMERNLRAALMLPNAGFSLFFTRPFSLVFIILSILVLGYCLIKEIKK